MHVLADCAEVGEQNFAGNAPLTLANLDDFWIKLKSKVLQGTRFEQSKGFSMASGTFIFFAGPQDDLLRPFLKASAPRWFRAPQGRLTKEMAQVLQAQFAS